MDQPKPASHPMADQSQSTLLRMPAEILHLIFEEVYADSLTDFKQLRFVSQVCRHESEYLVYRTLHLYGGTRFFQEQCLERIAEIRKRDGKLRKYLKHIVVGSFKDDYFFACQLPQHLLDMLQSIDKLLSITWKTARSPPFDFLDILQKFHPAAQIHLAVHDRGHPQKPLSAKLLTSPQLRSIDLTVLWTSELFPAMASELPLLANCLSQNNHAQSVSLVLENIGTWHASTMLSWDYMQDVANHATHYTRLLQRNINADPSPWTKLRRIDIGEDPRHYFFDLLTNRAVNLESLKLGLGSWRDIHIDLEVITNLLDSLNGLRELDFSSVNSRWMCVYLPAMLHSTGKSLRKLKICSSLVGRNAWGPSLYSDVLQIAPGLEEFHAKLESDEFEGRWSGAEVHEDAWTKYGRAWKRLSVLPPMQVEKRCVGWQHALGLDVHVKVRYESDSEWVF